MIDPKKVQEVLDNTTYKTFNWFLQPSMYSGFWDIAYTAEIKDNFSDKIVKVGSNYPIFRDDPQHVKNIMWYLIKEFEIHEAGEQFWVNGERPFDPHKELKVIE